MIRDPHACARMHSFGDGLTRPPLETGELLAIGAPLEGKELENFLLLLSPPKHLLPALSAWVPPSLLKKEIMKSNKKTD